MHVGGVKRGRSGGSDGAQEREPTHREEKAAGRRGEGGTGGGETGALIGLFFSPRTRRDAIGRAAGQRSGSHTRSHVKISFWATYKITRAAGPVTEEMKPP